MDHKHIKVALDEIKVAAHKKQLNNLFLKISENQHLRALKSVTKIKPETIN